MSNNTFFREFATGAQWIVYANAKGEHPGQIMRMGRSSNPKSIPLQAGYGESILLPEKLGIATASLSEAEHMIDLKTKKPVGRPRLSISDVFRVKVGGLLKIKVPIPSKVKLPYQQWFEVDDGVLEFEYASVGTRTVFLRPPWPFMEKTIQIVVEE